LDPSLAASTRTSSFARFSNGSAISPFRGSTFGSPILTKPAGDPFIPSGPGEVLRVSDPLTARGTCQGSRPVLTASTPCALFLGTRLDLLWTVQSLGFHPTHVHLRDRGLASTVRTLVPGVAVSFDTSAVWRAQLPSVSFVQGNAHSFPFLFESAEAIFSTRVRSRHGERPPSGWRLTHTRATHASVGGVTDTADRCFLWTRARANDSSPLTRSITLPTAVPRDVHSVVNDVVSGSTSRGPVSSRLPCPAVTELSPGLYHAGGLFPSDISRPRFRVRSVFSPTKWCDRPLTLSERAAVFDVPHHVVTTLPPAAVERLLVSPGRTLERCLHGLMASEGLLDRGGCLNFDGSPQRPPEEVLSTEGEEPADASPAPAVASTVPEQRQDGRNLKATKADDAAVPVWLWNEAVLEDLSEAPSARGHSTERVDQAMDSIRSFLLRVKCKRGVTSSFFHFVRTEYPTLCMTGQSEVAWFAQTEKYHWIRRAGHQVGRKLYQGWWTELWDTATLERLPGWDAVRRVADSSWWEWDEGSAPLYWRWPAEYRNTIRDGLEIWIRGPKPKFQRPQRPEKDPATRAKVVKKLATVRKRKYIAPGKVESLTDFFTVPKGEDDIRVVYNGTSSGLNEILWVPGFPMPTADTILRSVFPHTWMDDSDLGEFFLNFILNETLRELAGVDLTQYRTEEELAELGETIMAKCWERWVRCAMGLKPSPYQTGQGVLFAEDVIRGDRFEEKNIFRWHHLELNLPGSETYDPTKPWAFKIRLDGTPAADFSIYVDDNRGTGNTKKEAREAARKVASTCNYLGIQDASRKRRAASQTPGAWAGSVIHTDGKSVYVLVSQEKWDKSKGMIRDTLREMEDNGNILDHKILERRRGFLLYVTRTYPAMVPYLKGIHLTLDGWRQGRDVEGWKLLDRESREAEEEGKERETSQGDNPPKQVVAKPRLQSDLEALLVLFSAVEPPKRRVRSNLMVKVYYGFGDASQDGFGFNIQIGKRIVYRFGQWSTALSEQSSNYRELCNLVVRLEELVEEGILRDCEVFIFTDNATAEAVYYKGNSSSRHLFELMLRLRKLEMSGTLILHVVHVAGTRMQLEGADGSSRGDQTTGVMCGQRVLKYVPIHLSAPEVQPNLVPWIRSWWDFKRGTLTHLDPDGWFTTGMTQGNFLWTPAPAIADVAAEQMARAVHKHPHSFHMFVVPRLMTSRWRRRVSKMSDCYVTLTAGFEYWGRMQHEPLLIYFCLPLSRHQPWKLRGTRLLAQADRKLREVQQACHGRTRCLLRQLLIRTRRLESMSESLVRPLLRCARLKPFPNQEGRGR
jgi:hypothetical protein